MCNNDLKSPFNAPSRAIWAEGAQLRTRMLGLILCSGLLAAIAGCPKKQPPPPASNPSEAPVGSVQPTVLLKADPLVGTAPLLVNFTATAGPGSAAAKFSWDFDGDGAFDREDPGSSSALASFTYQTGGSYTATVQLTAADQATAVATATITVSAPAGGLAVALHANPGSGSLPLAVAFTADASGSTGTITKYEWDFDGDGTFDLDSGMLAEVNHTYAEAGNYNAQVRVTDTTAATAVGQLAVAAGDVTPTPAQAGEAERPADGQVPRWAGIWQSLTGSRYVAQSGPAQSLRAWDLDLRDKLDNGPPTVLGGPVMLADGTILLTTQHIDGNYLLAIREGANQASASIVQRLKLGTYGGGEDLAIGNSGIIYTIRDPRQASGEEEKLKLRVALSFNGTDFKELWNHQDYTNLFVHFVSKVNHELILGSRWGGDRTMFRFADAEVFKDLGGLTLVDDKYDTYKDGNWSIGYSFAEDSAGNYYFVSGGLNGNRQTYGRYLVSFDPDAQHKIHYIQPVPKGYGDYWTTGPIIDRQDRLYLGTDGGHVFCWNPDGSAAWNLDALLPTQDAQISSIGVNSAATLLAFTSNNLLVSITPGAAAGKINTRYDLANDGHGETETQYHFVIDKHDTLYYYNPGGNQYIVKLLVGGSSVRFGSVSPSFEMVRNENRFCFTPQGTAVFCPDRSVLLGVK